MENLKDAKNKIILKLIKTDEEWIIRSVEEIFKYTQQEGKNIKKIIVREHVKEDLVKFKFQDVTKLQEAPESYAILIREVEGVHSIAIKIDYYHVLALINLLSKTSSEIPTIFDLLKNQIFYTDYFFKSVIIDLFTEKTLYSKLVLVKKDSYLEIDTSPVDAIVLAIKSSIPIYVNRSVVDSIGVTGIIQN